MMALVFTFNNFFEDVESALNFGTQFLTWVDSDTSPFDLLNELVKGLERLETGELTLTITESLL